MRSQSRASWRTSRGGRALPASEENCYYERVGEHRFAPTEHVGGAWRDDEQHFSPLGGLIAHALDGHVAGRPPDGMQLGRLSFDILGQIPRDVCDVEVTTLRPGRTIELLGATVSIGGRAIVLARAWRLGAGETSQVAGDGLARLPSPERSQSRDLTDEWKGGFIRSLDVRMASPSEPGRARGWVRSPLAVVAGEPVSVQTRFLALVDTANGIAVRRSPTTWMFPNVDLSIHLFRSPTGAWTGLDTAVSWGPGGLGVTSTVLHDVEGPVGFAQQSLTLRPLPKPWTDSRLEPRVPERRGDIVTPEKFDSEVLALERDGHVATLWLDRSEARNAMGRQLFDDLPRAVATLDDDDNVRAIILAARGPHFCVGLDLKEMGPTLLGAGGGTASGAERSRRVAEEIHHLQEAANSLAASPKPVIAAVQGYCIGGGVDLIAACDVRVASHDAIFSVREAKMAIVADLGSLQRLPKIIGQGHVAELALTGKDIDAERAATIGLVNHVLDGHEATWACAKAIAEEIAANSPLAVQGTKAVLAANDGRTVDEGLEYVATWNTMYLSSADLTEALAAFLEKRPPRFEGR